MPRRFIILALFLLPLLVGFAPPRQTEVLPGQQVILRLDDRVVPFHVPAPEQAGLGIQSATFIINWNPATCTGALSAWPQEAKTAFQYAANIWASLVHSNIPVTIDACWRSDLGSNVLGSAGPTYIYQNFPGAPFSSTWYPVALANALSNSDRNGSTAEIRANFSSTFSWYYGTDGTPPSNRLDFASVVLHEIGHGLGFLGSMDVAFSEGTWGYSGYPFSYDRFTEDGAGTPLLNYPSPSASLKNALTSGAVFFDGPTANSANGGARVPLYAPSVWQDGSSYSHLAESYNNTINALMTYSLAWGESEHDPGPVTMGIMQDIGWTVNYNFALDLQITKQVVGSGHQPGDPVTFTLTIQNNSTFTATSVIVTDTLSSDIQSPGWSTSFAGVTVQPGTTYVWNLPDLAGGASGVITVTGTLNAALPPEFSILNKATITAADNEINTYNNSSTAVIGTHYYYLPLIIRGPSSPEAQLIDLINTERVSNGLSP
ncbi:MAG: DUF11 domain-containing protein, partial [Chloroflexi bacterium]